MRRDDLIHQLGGLAAYLPAVLPPSVVVGQASAACATARVAFGAAAVSIAALRDEQLHYVAAAGEGAETIVGPTLPTTRGLAGYVAMSGQSLAVDRPTDDPRFARDVAERTGFVPTTMLIVPVHDERGDLVGVLSVLDRTLASADALVLASSFAAQFGMLLPTIDEVGRTARLLLEAVIDAVVEADADLGSALRRRLTGLPETDAELAAIAATLGDLRRLDPAVRTRVGAVVAEIVALAAPRRRR
ncbi:hypothetical protein BH23ACT3_BH23ACT3_22120 [soil metagenome]